MHVAYVSIITRMGWLDYYRLLVQIFLCLKLNWFKACKTGAVAGRLLRTNVVSEGKESTASGSAGSGPGAARVLQNSCTNHLHASTLALMDSSLQQRLRLISTVAMPFEAWYSRTNKDVRSPDECRKFYTAEAETNSFPTLNAVVANLESWEALGHCGLQVHLSPQALAAYQGDLGHMRILEQDRWAEDMVAFVAQLLRFRFNRMCWLWRGVPGYVALILSATVAVAKLGLDRLKHAYDAWCLAQSRQHKGKYLLGVLGRSIFKNKAWLNVARICRDAGWMKTALVEDACKACFMGFGQSKVVEDANHFIRCCEQRGQNSNVAALLRLWHELRRKGVLSEVHHYSEVSTDGCPWPVGKQAVPEAAMKPKLGDRSIPDIDKCAGKSAKAPWVTFSPGSWSAQAGEQTALEEAARIGNFAAMEDAWACCVLRAGMLVRQAGTQNWLFCLGDIGFAATVGWPVEISSSGGQETFRLKQLAGSADLQWVCCFDLGEWQGQEVTWHSPLHRMVAEGATSVSGIVASPAGPVMPVLHIAARAAFWDYSAAKLGRLAEHLGAGSCKGLYAILKALVEKILNPTPEELLAILEKRLLLDSEQAFGPK